MERERGWWWGGGGGVGNERTVGLWFVSLMYYLDLPT